MFSVLAANLAFLAKTPHALLDAVEESLGTVFRVIGESDVNRVTNVLKILQEENKTSPLKFTFSMLKDVLNEFQKVKSNICG